jgi:hypothetical protein
MNDDLHNHDFDIPARMWNLIHMIVPREQFRDPSHERELENRGRALSNSNAHVSAPRNPPLRVAFVSSFFREHSVGRLLNNVIKLIASNHKPPYNSGYSDIEVILVHVSIWFALGSVHIMKLFKM